MIVRLIEDSMNALVCPSAGAFVESFIHYTDFAPAHAIDRFLPDANVEIIIDLTNTPKSIYDNVTLKEIQFCRGCHSEIPVACRARATFAGDVEFFGFDA